MRHALKVRPLAFWRLLLERLPAVLVISRFLKKVAIYYLHLGLDHGVYELMLALGDLDDFLDKTRANSALQIRDAAIVSYIAPMGHATYLTYASAVYWGSGSNLVLVTARSGV